MQNCPICHATDNNPSFCSVCEYDPKAEAEELAQGQREMAELDEEFLDFCNDMTEIKEEEEFENALIARITAANPGATQCPTCHKMTFVGGVCMYCFFDDSDDEDDFDDRSERDPLTISLPRDDV